MKRLCRGLAGALCVFALTWSAAAVAVPCESLKALSLPDTQITVAESIKPPFDASSPPFGSAIVFSPFCRVAGVIDPAIKFEVWLPPQGKWNHRLLGVGSGGAAGLINRFGMIEGLARGYAAVSSDLGHEGGPIDFTFATGDVDAVADWGYRGTHVMTTAAKAITEAYYKRPIQRSYFKGCSGGGRQGLMEAQRFPDDYDGIIAGDPTSNFTRLTIGGRLWVAQATLKDPAHYIPAAKIFVIADAVIAACDAQDGVRDEIISDPQACHFDPKVLQCKSGDHPDCLTAAQVETMRTIYGGAHNAKGVQIYPGYLPGGELGPGGWAGYVSGDAPKKGFQFQYADGFVRYMVQENPNYDSLKFNFDADLNFAVAKLSATIDAIDPSLSRFQARGGKLIQYHGWSDIGVSPLDSINYYNSVVKAFAPNDPQRGQRVVRNFYRLFMVPGMQHCGGGPGPDQFDTISALEAWVELGRVPNRILASHIGKGTVDRTRPLCPYPAQAKWVGQGSTDDAKNFVCVEPAAPAPAAAPPPSPAPLATPAHKP